MFFGLFASLGVLISKSLTLFLLFATMVWFFCVTATRNPSEPPFPTRLGIFSVHAPTNETVIPVYVGTSHQVFLFPSQQLVSARCLLPWLHFNTKKDMRNNRFHRKSKRHSKFTPQKVFHGCVMLIKRKKRLPPLYDSIIWFTAMSWVHVLPHADGTW